MAKKPKKPAPFAPEDIERAFNGDIETLGRIFAYIEPLLRAEAAYVLARVARGRNASQYLPDYVQDLAVHFLEKDGRTLRSWFPERGLGLESFVRMVARRRIFEWLRSRKKNRFTESPTDPEMMQQMTVFETEFDRYLVNAEIIAKLLEEVDKTQGEQGQRLIRLLIVEGYSAGEVATMMGTTSNAIHNKKKRLLVLLRKLWKKLFGADPE